MYFGATTLGAIRSARARARRLAELLPTLRPLSSASSDRTTTLCEGRLHMPSNSSVTVVPLLRLPAPDRSPAWMRPRPKPRA